MKQIEINGIAYDIEGVIYRTELGTAKELLQSAGFGIKTLSERIRNLGTFLDILEDVDQLEAWSAFLWLVRRNSGEAVTFEEASHVRIESIRWVGGDAPAEDDAAAPKDPTGSGQDAARAVAGTKAKTSSKTSKSRSTRTSSSSRTTGQG
ncbi:hypothetical protein SPF06_01080 [Sinomonas sp. JGH33]|uniref:Uncharacterized protein n=1 Tax=Sinomonas terricola TaxID=3110330 RepID=A0ABU5T0X4_9MICC|nr:hypothetical protein [Sinomonas sp. JGH33]MEA5453304.1 hypothetical protein [Sinomonas sp. JGH33]